MNEIILEALKLGLWRQLDVQFAYMLVNDNHSSQNSLTLAIITLSFYVRRGHVCLPLSMLTPTQLFFGLHIPLARKACQKAGNLSISCWEKLLLSNFIVSDGLFLSPLVLDKRRLYLYRMWKYECLVADFFHYASRDVSIVSENKACQIVRLLDQFFPVLNKNDEDKRIQKNKSIDWQKVAVVMALIRRVVIISGAPGTGKTSIISKLLIILSLLNSNSSLNIKMATPTGKSAARLNENVGLIAKKFNLSHILYGKQYFFVKAVTLHRLLGMYFSKENVRRAKKNFLFLDYLIIDEASMIDLSMMAKLISSLPLVTKIIFLGDHKQLPSIEAGSVFSDICYFVGKGYTFKFFEQLRKLTNYSFLVNRNKYDISDSLCLLKKNYRFGFLSGIKKLAHAVNLGNRHMALSLLTSHSTGDLNYVDIKSNTDYFNMLITCAFGYFDYFKNIVCYSNKDLSFILNLFNRYRVLCALREGPFGVLRLNSLIEDILSHYGCIEIIDDYQNYIGKPIIITSNEPSLSLFNGEVGVMLPDRNSNINDVRLFAYFLSSDNSVKKISLRRLPKYETSFVITIHKSQGSEFKNVVLILPNKIVPILSRELLYTGITRACKSLLIYATKQVIDYSINNQSKRFSGLIDRLKKLQAR